ncbi:TraG family conjugative transposon ATPase [Galbibacter sp. EGI 63066]|uniref:TraG family conjugative transposon ATPase n=1 Tax=Galbibacter sp. EGI 63066 TaxID=2993559 RepID=UPI002249620F|nr:TraG family conjugative transposon ATPase [Galbibacter sp. EGI 63066]MCX2680987.1 TraG family conjugative transposon ATPase [Galbibacter sp. EGI 63066]
MIKTNAHTYDMETVFPVWKIEDDLLLSRQGDITAGFKVALPELFTLSEKEYEALHYAWVKAVKVLPKHSLVHKQDWFTEAGYRGDFSGDPPSFLSRESEMFFNERPYLEHECYLYITRKHPDHRLSTSAFSNLLSGGIVPKNALDPLFVQELGAAIGMFEQILSDSGLIQLRRLKPGDWTGTKQKAGILERYCHLLPKGARPELGDIEFKPEWKVGENYCQMYTLADVEDLPGKVAPSTNYEGYATDRTRFPVAFAAPLGHLLPCNHIYNQYIVIGDAGQTLKKMESKRLRLQSLSAYSRENTISRDATSDFLNEAIGKQRMPIKAHFGVIMWTGKREQLKDLRNLVSSALSRIDAVPRLETRGAPQLFWAGIPGNAADIPVNDTFDTFAGQATCFFNMETAYRSSISPVGIRLGERLYGAPVHVDISDEPIKKGIITNRNKFILGPSGSGKSFFTNHMVRTYYEQGTHIVLVDVGHSYRGLCDLVKGYYFTYQEDDPIRFNPFFTEGGKRPDTEKKESLKTLLLALWKKDDEPFKRSEYVALSNALTGYYDHLAETPGTFPCFNSFYEFLKGEFSQALKRDRVKDRDFDMENFLYVLRPYYKGGEFDYLLNARENLDLLHQRFIVFELDNIKDHPILFPVVTIIIMEIFISKMRKLQGIRKMILIEEAWKAIAKEGMAEYIKYLFKTVRKFFGEAVVVTQEVEDIISSPIVKQAIINNSDCKILLDQGKYRNKFDQVQELLGLSEKEKALVLSVNKANDPKRKYKEVFISLGGQLSKVYRTEVSTAEYLAYTTEQSEKARVEEYTSRFGGDMQKAIRVLAGEMKNEP